MASTTATTPSKNSGIADASSPFYVVNSAAQWKQQLITKEDPNHVHKTLGILVLCSYVWRLSQVGDSDMGFATHPHWTVPTLLLHLALNASSFEFKIPAKRIASGYRIWPEYRLHSLVFLCRSLAMMFVFWVESEFHIAEPQHWLNIVILLATMAAADLSSMTQGKHQSGFARELDVPAIVKYFFSFAQFYATSMILTGQRRSTMQFLMVIIIQGNAFLMTIRRKNLASHALLTTLYGLALAGAGYVAWYELQRGGRNTLKGMILCANVALVLRTGPRLPVLRYVQDNKYAIWLAMYMVQETYIRPNLDQEYGGSRRVVQLTASATMFALGAYKHLQEQREKSRHIKSV